MFKKLLFVFSLLTTHIAFAGVDDFLVMEHTDNAEGRQLVKLIRLGMKCEFNDRGVLDRFRVTPQSHDIRLSKSIDEVAAEQGKLEEEISPDENLRKKVKRFFSLKEEVLSQKTLTRCNIESAVRCIQSIKNFNIKRHLSNELNEVAKQIFEYNHTVLDEVTTASDTPQGMNLTDFIQGLLKDERSNRGMIDLLCGEKKTVQSPGDVDTSLMVVKSREYFKKKKQCLDSESLELCSIRALYKSIEFICEFCQQYQDVSSELLKVAQTILTSFPDTTETEPFLILCYMNEFIKKEFHNSPNLNLEPWFEFAKKYRETKDYLDLYELTKKYLEQTSTSQVNSPRLKRLSLKSSSPRGGSVSSPGRKSLTAESPRTLEAVSPKRGSPRSPSFLSFLKKSSKGDVPDKDE